MILQNISRDALPVPRSTHRGVFFECSRPLGSHCLKAASEVPTLKGIFGLSQSQEALLPGHIRPKTFQNSCMTYNVHGLLDGKRMRVGTHAFELHWEPTAAGRSSLRADCLTWVS